MTQKRINTLTSECEEYIYNRQLITEEDRQESWQQEDQEELMTQMARLETELKLAKENQQRLKIKNRQLANMVVSSGLASVRNAESFIAKVQNMVNKKIISLSQETPYPIKKQQKYTSTYQNQHKKSQSNYSASSAKTMQSLPFTSTPLNRQQIKDKMSYLKRIQQKITSLRT